MFAITLISCYDNQKHVGSIGRSIHWQLLGHLLSNNVPVSENSCFYPYQQFIEAGEAETVLLSQTKGGL